MNAIRKSYPNVSNNHPLRNPIVNILPKILPATLNPKISTIDNSSVKQISKSNDSNNVKKLLDNNVQMTEEYIEKNKMHKSILSSLKADTVDIKATRTDKVSDKNDVKLNSIKLNSEILVSSSVVAKNSLQKSIGLPQIRRTTPRLAKTRSAQNMKLMAQALGSKNSSNCNTLKSKEKNTDKAIGEHDTASKVVSFIVISITLKKLLKKNYLNYMILYNAGQ
jgi:hypothetical protein